MAFTFTKVARWRWVASAIFVAVLASRSARMIAQASQDETATSSAAPAKVSEQQPGRQDEATQLALVKRYCSSCHSGDQPQASLDVTRDESDESIVRNHATWKLILDRIEEGDMPPADSPDQPTPEERQQMSAWLTRLFEQEAERNSDDPGLVLARRLSHAEFDHSVRDLTGVDIRPTKEFPVDPANESGFDNSAESLTMSPALFSKYITATRRVADHLVLTPRGFLFAPFPCVTETDRDNFCVHRIVDFYHRHDVKYEEYFRLLWEFSSLSSAEQTDERMAEMARESRLSPRYVEVLATLLNGNESIGPVAEIQKAWRDTVKLSATQSDARAACRKLASLVNEIRDDLTDPIPRVTVKGLSAGSQPLIVWWNEKQAANRRMFPGDGEDLELDAARNRFCQVFPDKFFVASRGHYSNTDLGANVRLLSAGFHLMQGFCRDDRPLQELILSDAERLELDQLWEDLEFVTSAPIRQYKDFLFFERAEPPQVAAGPEFDFARPENKDVTTSETIRRMQEVYLATASKLNASDEAKQAIATYFDSMDRRIRWIEDSQPAAESAHLEQLKQFAAKAWRQPLDESAAVDLQRSYRELRDQEQLSHEDAIRDCVASILLSPRFCFRVDAAEAHETTGTISDAADAGLKSPASRRLTDFELASRLSYFLWASLPDEELTAAAARGELSSPDVLHAQVDRMLNDPKVFGLASEFLANWLEIRRFEEHNAVDRNRFPSFDDSLRTAMFEEPLRFFVDQIQRDGSLDELLSAEHTFANEQLASHYGLNWKEEVPTSDSEQGSKMANRAESSDWRRFNAASKFGRGGLLPMSVFLTKNSPGLRTSPVKRGYWVVRRLLGEHIPAPPPNVPELPKDEKELGELSLSQLLAKHRDNLACASCHDRFDSVGLIFEAYGPIGEHRTVDLAGHPVQTEAVFPDGSHGRTLSDLQQYILNHRRDDLELNFIRKLMTYALGRSLQLSDTKTIETVRSQMNANRNSIRAAIHAIVVSPQFQRKRLDTVRP